MRRFPQNTTASLGVCLQPFDEMGHPKTRPGLAEFLDLFTHVTREVGAACCFSS